MIQNILALVIVITYSVWAISVAGPSIILILFITLSLPLALIWLGEYMGEYLGFMRGRLITETSPGCAVKAVGWILLIVIILRSFYLYFFMA